MTNYKLIASYQKDKKSDWEEFEKILVLTKKEILAYGHLPSLLKHLQEIGTLPKGYYHYPCLYKATKEDMEKK